MYDSSSAGCSTFAIAAQDTIEDVSFAPGPWSGRRNNLVTMIGARAYSTGVLSNFSFDHEVVFWRGVDQSLSTDATRGAEPVATVRVSFGPATMTVAGVYGADVDLSVLPGGGAWIPADAIAVEQRNLVAGTSTPLPRLGTLSSYLRASAAVPAIGSTTSEMLIDFDGQPGVLEGAHVPAGVTGAFASGRFVPNPLPGTDRVVLNTISGAPGRAPSGRPRAFPCGSSA